MPTKSDAVLASEDLRKWEGAVSHNHRNASNRGLKLRRVFRVAFLAPLGISAIALLSFPKTRAYAAQAGMNSPGSTKPNIVLVPGAYEDGTIWTKVIGLLQAKGFKVTVVPIPLTSLAADAAMTQSVLARQQAPTILVGHSWGGVVITEAGGAPNVIGLVYVAAVAPDVGEGSGDMLQHCPRKGPSHIYTDETGMKWLDPEAYPEAWAGDLDLAQAQILAAAQRPIATASFTDKVTHAAWHEKPSWFQISTQDMMQCTEMQRVMAERMGATTIELPASHASPLSHPDEVVSLILEAAEKAPAQPPLSQRPLQYAQPPLRQPSSLTVPPPSSQFLSVTAPTNEIGRIQGTLTYFFDFHVGNKPDSGSKVWLIEGRVEIPANKTFVGTSAALGTSENPEEYKVVSYSVADANGNFAFLDIPPGEYTVIMQSAHTKGTLKEKGNLFGRGNSRSARDNNGRVEFLDLRIKAGETADASRDFGPNIDM
jgi:pimeloyl-ACP methyl ester carboxylesterase